MTQVVEPAVAEPARALASRWGAGLGVLHGTTTRPIVAVDCRA